MDLCFKSIASDHHNKRGTRGAQVSRSIGSWVLSDQSELVSVCRGFGGLGGKLPPFCQRGGTVFLEPVTLVEMSFEIEVIVDG